MNDATFLTRVLIENYKSIAACDVRLGPLTFLVGPNGAGKSNFLDALRFVQDALVRSLEEALSERGGGAAVCHSAPEPRNSFGIRLEFLLPSNLQGHYALRISRQQEHWQVCREECLVDSPATPDGWASFQVRQGIVNASVPRAPATSDRLYLTDAAVLPAFAPVYDALARMHFYHPDSAHLKPGTGDANGKVSAGTVNPMAILARLDQYDPDTKHRVEEMVSVLLPGLQRVEVPECGIGKCLRFWLQRPGFAEPQAWAATQVSDGTLRLLGILAAAYEGNLELPSRPVLVAIDDADDRLDTMGVAVLRGALEEASLCTQVLACVHNPEFFNDKDVTLDSILAVLNEQGQSLIGPADADLRASVHRRQWRVDELLRATPLTPEMYWSDPGERPSVVLFTETPV
jgi:predicted ATPase